MSLAKTLTGPYLIGMTHKCDYAVFAPANTTIDTNNSFLGANMTNKHSNAASAIEKTLLNFKKEEETKFLIHI